MRWASTALRSFGGEAADGDKLPGSEMGVNRIRSVLEFGG